MAAGRVLAVMFVAFVQLPCTDAAFLVRESPVSAQGETEAKLAETVRALDTNGNGKVDESELTVFAKSQGLSIAEVLSEFKELDSNHDGALDVSEIGPLFAATNTEAENHATDVLGAPASAPMVSSEPVKILSAVAEPVSSDKGEEQQQEANLVKAPAAVGETLPVQLAVGVTLEDTLSAEKNTMGLDLAALEVDSQNQAEGAIAGRLAQRAQVLLARSAADEQKATTFDADVQSLRSNATTLARSVNERVRAAARAATAEVSKTAMEHLAKLQAEEHRAASSADDRREEARKAMVRVRKAQASLRSRSA